MSEMVSIPLRSDFNNPGAQCNENRKPVSIPLRSDFNIKELDENGYIKRFQSL